jgi:putative membrane protein
MKKILVRWGMYAIAIYAAITVVPGIHAQDTSVVAIILLALIFGLINALLRPLVKMLTCPLIILTLGLFTLIINTGLFVLAGWVGQFWEIGFTVDGFIHAFFGSLVVTVISLVLSILFRDALKNS